MMSSMKRAFSCGVIPIHVNDTGEMKVLLVQGYGGFWGMPKGHKEARENDFETAIRELYEETRIICQKYLDILLEETYTINRKQRSDVEKTVSYYIGIVEEPQVISQTSEVKDFGWFKLEAAMNLVVGRRKRLIKRAFDAVEDALDKEE